MNTSTKIIRLFTILTLPIILSSCAALGSKTLVNSFDQNINITNSTISLSQPNYVNLDFYGESVPNFYLNELEKIFKTYNIEVVKSDIYVDFDMINGNVKHLLSEVSTADYILFCKITRLTAMGQTRDYKVEYKIVDTEIYKVKYHCKYSSTFGQTYVMVPGSGLPGEEQLLRDAIKNGFQKIEKDLLKK